MLAYEIVSRFQPKSKRLRDKLQNKLQNNIAFTDQKLCNNKFMWCFRKMKLNFKIDIGILGNKLGKSPKMWWYRQCFLACMHTHRVRGLHKT